MADGFEEGRTALPLWELRSLSGPTSTSQSADDDEGLRGTGWGEGGPVYLET